MYMYTSLSLSLFLNLSLSLYIYIYIYTYIHTQHAHFRRRRCPAKPPRRQRCRGGRAVISSVIYLCIKLVISLYNYIVIS